MQWALNLIERGWIPDPLLRRGIRRLLETRIREISSDPDPTTQLVEQMRQSPLAIETETANEQHYELPPEFFQLVLGSHLKYSCCYWPEGTTSLSDAEALALELTTSRAEIEDGMEVLDLGCGWGSLSLWIAEHFTDCRVTAVSNSAPQGDFIRRRARSRGLANVEHLTDDMSHFQITGKFDRIVSVEMFEHMRNYSLLLERVAGWLKPDGKLFVHVFCHCSRPYFFEDKGPSDWMARHFFTGGLMPSEHLMEQFEGPVQLDRRWRLNGQHYERTALAWLENMDRHRDEIRGIFESVYGTDAEQWFHRWRLFFLACAELFGYKHGEEWFVSHSLWIPGEQAEA
ncbi:MAG: cyclopropane-fatty-acyl-phospholipid synthase family protein [Thermoanaerobaculia bacterium]